MTLRHLKIFVAVCDEGGVTAAARALYMAQPSVSLALQELESYYGVPFFDRIARRLHLTQAGDCLLYTSIPRGGRDQCGKRRPPPRGGPDQTNDPYSG